MRPIDEQAVRPLLRPWTESLLAALGALTRKPLPDPFTSNMQKKPALHRNCSILRSVLSAGACLGVAAPAHAAPLLTELEGTRQVCSFSPDAALARARRLQGEAEVKAAGVLPNPSLMVQHQRTFTGPEERETIVGLSMPFGVSGRRGLLYDAAARDVTPLVVSAAETKPIDSRFYKATITGCPAAPSVLRFSANSRPP